MKLIILILMIFHISTGFAQKKSCFVSGKITSNGNEVKNAEVRIGDFKKKTNLSGSFEFDSIPLGEYKLVVIYDHIKRKEMKVNIDSEKPYILNIPIKINDSLYNTGRFR